MVTSRRSWARWLLAVPAATLTMLVGHCLGHQLVLATGVGEAGAHVAHTADAANIANIADAANTANAANTLHAVHQGHDGNLHLMHGQVDHSHLLPLASGAFLALVLATLAVLVMVGRRQRLPQLGVRSLLGLQLAGFYTLEIVDWVVQGQGPAGLGPPPASPAILIGLLLQVPLAFTVHWLGRRVVAAARRLLRPPAVLAGGRAAPTIHPATPEFRPVSLRWSRVAGARGPPAGRFCTL